MLFLWEKHTDDCVVVILLLDSLSHCIRSPDGQFDFMTKHCLSNGYASWVFPRIILWWLIKQPIKMFWRHTDGRFRDAPTWLDRQTSNPPIRTVTALGFVIALLVVNYWHITKILFFVPFLICMKISSDCLTKLTLAVFYLRLALNNINKTSR